MGWALRVIGVGADGWDGVPHRLRHEIAAADVVLGGARHLQLIPDVAGQTREPWPSPLRAGIGSVLDRHAGRRVVALASGDPLVSGIGSTLIELLGRDAVSVEPAVSSVALARARMGWPAETVETISVVGRDVHAVLRWLAPGHRLIVLSSDSTTPATVAALLTAAGYGDSELTVLGDLGSSAETRASATASSWTGPAPQLNVIAAQLVGHVRGSLLGGLPDDAFGPDGAFIGRDARAAALVRLAPQPGQQLWDVGAGSGSVAIEWLRAHPSTRAAAVERRPDRADLISRNAERLGVPRLRVVEGSAPSALAELPPPDAVFLGGGVVNQAVIDRCLAALGPGGRLVAQASTPAAEALLSDLCHLHGGELVRLTVETLTPSAVPAQGPATPSVTQWGYHR